MGRRILLAGLTIIALFTAGCASDTATPSGSSTPSDTSLTASSETAPALPYAGAPKVPNPLPLSIVDGDPCADMLTPQQVETTLGAPNRTKRADEPSIGPGCDWLNTETTGHIIVRYAMALPGGLSPIYKNIKPRANPWKEIPSIQGFPAVAYVTASVGTPDRFCQISTGITDDLTVELSLFVSVGKIGKVVPCDAAEEVANQIMANLHTKAGM